MGIAKQWKEESEETKEPYLSDANKKKEDYKVKRAEYEASSKYKKWKKDVAEWNERHKEEWLEQEEELKEKREERKRKKEAKAKKNGDENKENKKKKAKGNKAKKKVTTKKRG